MAEHTRAIPTVPLRSDCQVTFQLMEELPSHSYQRLVQVAKLGGNPKGKSRRHRSMSSSSVHSQQMRPKMISQPLIPMCHPVILPAVLRGLTDPLFRARWVRGCQEEQGDFSERIRKKGPSHKTPMAQRHRWNAAMVETPVATSAILKVSAVRAVGRKSSARCERRPYVQQSCGK